MVTFSDPVSPVRIHVWGAQNAITSATKLAVLAIPQRIRLVPLMINNAPTMCVTARAHALIRPPTVHLVMIKIPALKMILVREIAVAVLQKIAAMTCNVTSILVFQTRKIRTPHYANTMTLLVIVQRWMTQFAMITKFAPMIVVTLKQVNAYLPLIINPAMMACFAMGTIPAAEVLVPSTVVIRVQQSATIVAQMIRKAAQAHKVPNVLVMAIPAPTTCVLLRMVRGHAAIRITSQNVVTKVPALLMTSAQTAYAAPVVP
jgi:hypothetical protein